MSWQPIETAPKDGTVILCFWAGSPVTFKNYAFAYFHESDEWVNSEDSDISYRAPDYWMPLPEPPTA